MRQIFIIKNIVIIALLAQSCTKDKAQINMKQLWDCNASQNYDSTKLASKLIGTWKWTDYFSELAQTKMADKDVKVIFTSTGTFTVTENSVIVTQGNWKLKIEDVTTYGLDLDTESIYLYGRILFCDNQVLFNDSYVDGEDHLFVRIN